MTDRRRLLRLAVLIFALVAIAMFVRVGLKMAFYAPATTPPENRISVGVDRLQPGQAVEVQAAGRDLIVIKTGAQQFVVLALRSPVLGCPVQYEPARKQLEDACNGDLYDVHGNLLQGVYPGRNLQQFRSELSAESDTLHITVAP